MKTAPASRTAPPVDIRVDSPLWREQPSAEATVRDAIAAELRRTALPPTGDVSVHAATLGDRAEVLGAITLALDETEWLRSAGLVAVAQQWARA